MNVDKYNWATLPPIQKALVWLCSELVESRPAMARRFLNEAVNQRKAAKKKMNSTRRPLLYHEFTPRHRALMWLFLEPDSVVVRRFMQEIVELRRATPQYKNRHSTPPRAA